MSGTHLHDLAQALVQWARAQDAVRAGFWYGGFGYDEVWPESDLDMAVLLRPGADPPALAASLVEALRTRSDGVRHQCVLADERRIVVWVGDAPTKVDVVYGTDPSELWWLADAVDVPAPRLVAAWPVEAGDEEVRLLLARAEAVHDPLDGFARRARAEGEIDKFVVAFDQCSAAHARSDAYAFYFHYNLALGRLLRVVQLARGGIRHLYLPRNVLSGLMPLDEQVEYRGLAGSLYLPDALERKRMLADQFLGVVKEAGEALGVRRSASDLGEFLERIQRRDRFFNVRDVALSFPGHLHPRRFFRASALARWAGGNELVRWLDETGVTDIVDLRLPDECERMPYTDAIRSRIRVHPLPLPGFPADHPDASAVQQIRDAGGVLRRVVEILGTARGAVVIHCHVGRDRTGWVCAVVQRALDLPRDGIVRDYVASRMGTRPEFMDDLLTELDHAGGIPQLLWDAGITTEMMDAARARLVQPAPPA